MAAFDDFAQGWTTGDTAELRDAFVALLRRRSRAGWRIPVKATVHQRRIKALERRKRSLELQAANLQREVVGIDGEIAACHRSLKDAST